MTALTVEIVDVASSAEPPGAELRYLIRNDSDATAWVVDDGWLAWRRDGRRIELCYARVPMRPGVEPFGYFDPEVVAIAPGGTLERTVTLSWPQPLSGMWNTDRVAAPPPGEYEVTVRIGYAATPKPEPAQTLDEGVEAPVLAWQREAVSEPATLVVTAWAHADERTRHVGEGQ